MNTTEELKNSLAPYKPNWDKMTKTEKQMYEDRLYALTSQLQFNAFNTAMALKEIRDMELFRAISYDSFEVFVECEIPWMKPDQAKNYCLILDTYGEKNKVKELLGKKGGFQLLIDTAREIKDRPEVLTDEKIEEIVSARTRELQEERKKLKEAKDLKDKLLEHKNQEIANLQKQMQIQDEEYQRVLNMKTNHEGVDWNLVNRLTNKKEIRDNIASSMLRINEEIAWISEIPSEMRDSELSGMLHSYLSLLQVSIDTIHTHWVEQLSEMPTYRPQRAVNQESDEEQLVP
jgi:hypothetical protein